MRGVGCARYARGSHAGCERRACGARERRQSRPERSRQAEGKNPFQLDSKEPQWDIQDYRKGEGRFASVAKQFPKEADELFLAARARLFRCRSGERSVALQELPQNAGHSMVIKESARICAGITKMYPLSLL